MAATFRETEPNAFAGAIPYLGAGGTTVYYAHQAGQAASGVATSVDPGVALTILDQALNLQVTYGAVMLSFLGAFSPRYRCKVGG